MNPSFHPDEYHIHTRHHPEREKVKFFVVTAHSNVRRFKRRPHLYKRFEEMCRRANVPLITVELQLGQRGFEVTNSGAELHVQLRSHEEFWHKENLINLGFAFGRKLFPNADKVAWIDSDFMPARPASEWFEETWHELQRYQMVQMWEWMQPLDIHQNPIPECPPNPSFMSNYVKFGTPYPKSIKGYPQSWGSPGGAWAANIEALDMISCPFSGPGIPDVSVLGAGDWYLAHCLISTLQIPDFEKRKYSKGYIHYWKRKQELCQRYIKRDVGYVPGLVLHEFHGPTSKRGYNTREQLYIDHQFDPYTDLQKDHQGIYKLETHDLRQIHFYDGVRAYFKTRDEDDIRNR